MFAKYLYYIGILDIVKIYAIIFEKQLQKIPIKTYNERESLNP